MNTSNTPSAKAAADLTGKEYRVVKMTSTGINLANTTGDKIVGTLLRAQPHQEDGVYVGKAVGILLAEGAIHFATLGFTSAAIAAGATLALDTASGNDGKLVDSSSNVVAIAWEAITGSDGAILRIMFL